MIPHRRCCLTRRSQHAAVPMKLWSPARAQRCELATLAGGCNRDDVAAQGDQPQHGQSRRSVLRPLRRPRQGPASRHVSRSGIGTFLQCNLNSMHCPSLPASTAVPPPPPRSYTAPASLPSPLALPPGLRDGECCPLAARQGAGHRHLLWGGRCDHCHAAQEWRDHDHVARAGFARHRSAHQATSRLQVLPAPDPCPRTIRLIPALHASHTTSFYLALSNYTPRSTQPPTPCRCPAAGGASPQATCVTTGKLTRPRRATQRPTKTSDCSSHGRSTASAPASRARPPPPAHIRTHTRTHNTTYTLAHSLTHDPHTHTLAHHPPTNW
jgi:hypothetical protein